MANNISTTIFRYDPDSDEEPKYQTYTIPKTERMLIGDVLQYIHDNLDGSLAYRWECRTRQCGGCTVLVNRKPGLVCRELAVDQMVLEPLPYLPIVRDLVVDKNALLNNIYTVQQFTRSAPSTKHPESVEPSTIQELRIFRQCIQCLACVAVCPATEVLTSDLFPGPTKLIQIAKFAFDDRDVANRGQESDKSGLYDCVSCNACAEVCPHEIDIHEKVITALRNKCYAQGIGAGTKYIQAFKDRLQAKGKVSASSLLLKSQGYVHAILKAPQGARMIIKGKLVSPLQEPIASIEDIRALIQSSEQKE